MATKKKDVFVKFVVIAKVEDGKIVATYNWLPKPDGTIVPMLYVGTEENIATCPADAKGNSTTSKPKGKCSGIGGMRSLIALLDLPKTGKALRKVCKQ